MKKTLKILVLAVLTVVLALCAVACSDEEESVTGIQYKKAKGDEGYTVTGYIDDGKTTVLDLGAVQTEKGIVIERIKTNAFKGNDTITKLIVPSSVVKIDKGAFSGMNKLEEIEIPFVGATRVADSMQNETPASENKSVDAMRNFGYIFGEEEYDYGKKITMNYNSASSTDFYIPLYLNKITVNAGDTEYKIPMYAFNGLKDVATVQLKGNITAIGEYAFAKSDVETVNVPETVTKILKGAFSECGALNTGLTFDGTPSVTDFGDYAFYATKIENFVVPDSVKNIGEYCFASVVSNTLEITNASKLKTVVLSTYIENIGNYAFAYCEDLISVNTERTLNDPIVASTAFEGAGVGNPFDY